MLRLLSIVTMVVFGAFAAQPCLAAGEQVDLELVLAVDASGSVNAREYQLQLSGIANAFRDPAVQQGIVSGPRGRIAVSLLVWSDAAFKVNSIGWHILSDRQGAQAFARLVETVPQREGGGTGIGNGLAVAVRSIAGNGIEATRRVVDISGDGPETTPWFGDGIELPQARLMAVRDDVTVNGLAILSDFPKLDEWYRSNVKSGPDSFVMRAGDYGDFATAIRDKLWREITIVIGDAERWMAPSPLFGEGGRQCKSSIHQCSASLFPPP